MTDLYFHGIWRMDWGLGNPNKTGALIAILMVAVWFLTLGRRWGFWLALALFTGLGVCLVHTMSRGALIALFAGMIPLIMAAPRPWGRGRIVGVLAALCIVAGVSFYLNAGERFGQGITQEDRSITNRFKIWNVAPRMMVDAPGGWGIGNSGSAYMEWYQPLSSTEGYRTLVNSHLTWMVELGWPLRVVYLLGWGALLLLCWPGASCRWLAVPLGIWITFFVAAAFSSVAESPWLWIVPLASLLPVLWYRIRCRIWPAGKLWLIPTGLSLLLCAIFYGVGSRHDSMIQKRDGILFYGKGDPRVWIFPDVKILGNQWGRSLRGELKLGPKEHASIALIENLSKIPSFQGKSVIVTGDPAPPAVLAKVMQEASSLTLINPSFDPGEAGFNPKNKKVMLIMGEFSESPSAMAWKEIIPAKILPGVGDYLPDWKAVLGEKTSL